jgi:hypothetical protein
VLAPAGAAAHSKAVIAIRAVRLMTVCTYPESDRLDPSMNPAS